MDKCKPQPNDSDDDIIIGQKYRAYNEASNIINKIFVKLSEFDTFVEKPKQFNKEC